MLRPLTSAILIFSLLAATTPAAAATPNLDLSPSSDVVRPEQREPVGAALLGLVVGFGVGHAYGGVYGDYGFVFTIIDAALVGGLVGCLTLMLQRSDPTPSAGLVPSEDQEPPYYIPAALGAILSGAALGVTRIVEASTAGVSAHRMNQSQLRITPMIAPGGPRGLGLSFRF